MGTVKPAVEFSPPHQSQRYSWRYWGLPHYLMTELHHVRPARLLLHLPQKKGEQRERQAAGGQPGKRSLD